MLYYFIKVITSSIIIVAISEISKRSSLMGSILASIPLISFLAFIWLYIETKDISKIADLSTGIFWLVIPSLSFFLLFPYLLKKNIQFYLSMTIAAVMMVIFYFLMLYILKKFGIKI
ncbi:MAG: DUF3147 family protein [Bacteroidetes bacterium]|nr:DUF3147 family protein [Bacteroidota bacterium]